ncbi:hypothetical protein K1719_028421 [Acacia pycnantha]|nr:hypothetical protein K1719_028421 [Acacia pycnantha]
MAMTKNCEPASRIKASQSRRGITDNDDPALHAKSSDPVPAKFFKPTIADVDHKRTIFTFLDFADGVGKC